jgi:hypothetical protein
MKMLMIDRDWLAARKDDLRDLRVSSGKRPPTRLKSKPDGFFGR